MLKRFKNLRHGKKGRNVSKARSPGSAESAWQLAGKLENRNVF